LQESVFFFRSVFYIPLRNLFDTQISQAAKDASACQDKLIDVLNRIGRFFQRLDIYTGFTPTAAMTDMMVEIMVEIINILAIATKEVNSGRFSESMSRGFAVPDSHLFRKVFQKADEKHGPRR
jgi:hypothetical protein